jgi:hypothetical protein
MQSEYRKVTCKLPSPFLSQGLHFQCSSRPTISIAPLPTAHGYLAAEALALSSFFVVITSFLPLLRQSGFEFCAMIHEDVGTEYTLFWKYLFWRLTVSIFLCVTYGLEERI